jgi:tetratricopeptide (TPR) repeat protein
LAISKKNLGANHPDVATSLHNLAAIYSGQAQYARAERLYRLSLKINEKTLGLNHPAVARILKSLATLYRETHQPDAARLLEKRASRILATPR